MRSLKDASHQTMSLALARKVIQDVTVCVLPPEQVPSCETCGACCVGDMVAVSKAQAKGPLRKHVSSIKIDGQRHYYVAGTRPDSQEKRCCFFLGSVGGRCSCAAYNTPKKPEACDHFTAGSLACQDRREQAGLPRTA